MTSSLTARVASNRVASVKLEPMLRVETGDLALNLKPSTKMQLVLPEFD